MNSVSNDVFMGAPDDDICPLLTPILTVPQFDLTSLQSEKLQAIPPVTMKRKLANETVVPQSRTEITATPTWTRRGTSYGLQEPLTKKARATPLDIQATPVVNTRTTSQRLDQPPPAMEDPANAPNDSQGTPLTNNVWGTLYGPPQGTSYGPSQGTSYGPQYIPVPAVYPFTFQVPFNPSEVEFAIPPPPIIPALRPRSNDSGYDTPSPPHWTPSPSTGAVEPVDLETLMQYRAPTPPPPPPPPPNPERRKRRRIDTTTIAPAGPTSTTSTSTPTAANPAKKPRGRPPKSSAATTAGQFTFITQDVHAARKELQQKGHDTAEYRQLTPHGRQGAKGHERVLEGVDTVGMSEEGKRKVNGNWRWEDRE
ncbi:MAG: hypothetical protein Q9181_005252 [Wetmoreana brouardii]